MRIGCFGSHSTGKTTLVNLVGDVTGLFVGNEIAREVAREHGKTPADMTGDERIGYQAEVLQRQIAMERCLTEFVFDRTVIDVTAYSLAAYEDLERLPLYVNDLNRIAHPVSRYDLLLYFPIRPEIGVEDDGERHTDPVFQRRIDDLIWRVVGNLKDRFGLDLAPRIHRIESEGPRLRVEEVLDLLRKKGFRWHAGELFERKNGSRQHLFGSPAHPRRKRVAR